MAELNTVDEAVLNLYIEKIEKLASNQIAEDFFNTGSNHALIVLKAIAKYAQKNIKVFAGNLCTSISNESGYISNLRTFLSNGGTMQVLLCNYEQGEDHFNKDIFKLFNEFKTSVTLKKTKRLVEISNGNSVHFTVADSRMYRFETDIIKKVARGNFNDPKNSKILENIFDKLFSDKSSSAIEFLV